MPPPVMQTSSTLDGLPKPFVNALRTLFEVLDDKGTGFVKFTDIEVRWQDDGTKGLPKGVIESLRKVTPANGLLSFERFCAGLKICLLRNQMEGGRTISGSREASQRPPSAPLLDMEAGGKGSNWSGTVRQSGSGGMAQQRTLSMPQLPAHQQPPLPPPQIKPHLYGPPKPPRVGLSVASNQQNQQQPAIVGGQNSQVDKAEIRSALHSWQMGMMMEEERRFPQQRPRPLGEAPQTALVEPGQNGQQNMYKKNSSRRKEPRRHTLQNGIDYNMLKRMKQIEVEKDILMIGLEAVERARDWYLKQVQMVQDKMQYASRMGYVDGWSDEERMGLQRARILEVNRHLALLTEGGDLPLHINLALPHHPPPPHLPQQQPPTGNHVISQLKHQNQFLTQEVTKKNDRITALEREKAALIRELFHTRSQNRPPPAPMQDNTPYL